MISSMTGYARREIVQQDFTLKMEVKSLNHRFLEANIYFSKELTFLEPEARKTINKYFMRGKIDGSVTIKFTNAEFIIPRLNNELLYKVLAALSEDKTVKKKKHSIDVSHLLSLPGMYSITLDDQQLREKIEPLFAQHWEELVLDLKKFRLEEGQLLLKSVESILDSCGNKITLLKDNLEKNKNYIEQSVKDKIQQLKLEENFDAQRVSEEIFFYIIKTDITEEVIRLGAHFERFRDILNNKDQIGKELEFLLQEMNREVQTILSKSVMDEVSNAALELKYDIERLRQQIQNLE